MPRINNPLNLAGSPLGVGGFNSDLANFNFTEEITSTDNVCPVTIKRGDCIHWHPANAGTIENCTGNFYINTEEVQFPEMGMAWILLDVRGIKLAADSYKYADGDQYGYYLMQSGVIPCVFNIMINNKKRGMMSFDNYVWGSNRWFKVGYYALLSISFSSRIDGVNLLSYGGLVDE